MQKRKNNTIKSIQIKQKKRFDVFVFLILLLIGIFSFSDYYLNKREILFSSENLAIGFFPPTPFDGAIQLDNIVTLNLSIDYNLKQIDFNWNGKSVSLYDDSLIFKMSFENNSILGEIFPTIFDVSSNNYRGAASSGYLVSISSEGKSGKCATFRGGLISIPSTTKLNLGSQQTISLWFYPTQLPGYSASAAGLITKGTPYYQRPYGLWYLWNGDVLYQIFSDATQGVLGNCNWYGGESSTGVVANVLPNTGWHNIIGVYNGSYGKVFLDGKLVYNHSCVVNFSKILTDTTSLQIGHSGYHAPFYGAIDEVNIWNKSISDEEANLIYVTNLKKHALDKWELTANLANLSYGTYLYSASARDMDGNSVQTDTRSVTIIECDEDADCSLNKVCRENSCVNLPVEVSFAFPTPINGTIQAENHTLINISIIGSLQNAELNWNGNISSLYDNSLKLFMNFDKRSNLKENESFVADLSNYGNNGKVIGASWTSEGKSYGAYNFQQTNNEVYLGHPESLNIYGSMSVSAWINPSVYNNYMGVYTKFVNGLAYQYLYAIDDTNKIVYYNPATGWKTFELTIPDNEWTFVSWVYNGNTIFACKNTICSKPLPITAPSSYLTLDAGVGRTWGSGTEWHGKIDEIMVWNRSLSKSEIFQLYESSFTRFGKTLWTLAVNKTNLNEGTYNYSASVKDLDGNSVQTDTRSVTIGTIEAEQIIPDTTSPTLTTTLTQGQIYTNLPVHFLLSSNEVLLSCAITFDNGETNFTMSLDETKTNADYSAPSLADGSYNALFWCEDEAGNSAELNYEFSVNAVAEPTARVTLEILSPTEDITATKGELFEFRVDVSCFDADCGEIQVTLDPEEKSCFGKMIDAIINFFRRLFGMEVYFAPSAKGVILNEEGAVPFWTTEINPRIISLNAGESQEVVFVVNASGDTNPEGYEFFAYANIAGEETRAGESSRIIVAIDIEEPAAICTPNMIYTDWTGWTDVECVGNKMNQSKSRTYYDSNNCGEIDNATYYEYNLVDDDRCVVSDTTPPFIIGLRNFEHNVSESFNEQITAQDESGVIYFSLNDTSVFAINNEGIITNVTGLNEGTFWLKIRVEDANGNSREEIFSIRISSLPKEEIINAIVPVVSAPVGGGGGGGGGGIVKKTNQSMVQQQTAGTENISGCGQCNEDEICQENKCINHSLEEKESPLEKERLFSWKLMLLVVLFIIIVIFLIIIKRRDKDKQKIIKLSNKDKEE